MTSPVKPSEAEKALTHPDMAEAAPEPGAAAAVGALSDEHLARKAGACARPLGGMWVAAEPLLGYHLPYLASRAVEAGASLFGKRAPCW